jgi:hypothetical protein
MKLTFKGTKMEKLWKDYSVNNDWNYEIINISPARAEQLLQSNAGNRKMSKSTMLKYASTMASGDWKLSPQPIVIDKDGTVMDGQHRLSGIVSSGTSIRAIVISNVDRDVFEVLDRGKTRTLSDNTGMNAKLLQVARFVSAAASPVKATSNTVTDAQVIRMAELLAAPHAELIAHCGRSVKIFSSVPFRAAACLRMLRREDSNAYVLSVYKGMVDSDTKGLPPIAMSLVKSAFRGTLKSSFKGEGDRAMFARAWEALDATRAHLRKVVLNSHSRQLDDMRITVLRALRDA